MTVMWLELTVSLSPPGSTAPRLPSPSAPLRQGAEEEEAEEWEEALEVPPARREVWPSPSGFTTWLPVM